MRHRNNLAGLVAVAAILLVIIGAVRVGWFVIGLAIFIAVLVVVHFWGKIREKIHDFLKAFPKEWVFGTWAVLTGIGTIGAMTYFLSGVPARYINASLYLVALVMSVPYMVRRVPETGWYRFWAVVWSFMIIPCIWKLVPFVGWLLAIVDIVLFWHFHYVADYQNQPQAQVATSSSGNSDPFSSVNNITDFRERKTIEYCNTGSIEWKFFPINKSGRIAHFTPLMWCRIPQFWRSIEFVKNEHTLTVIEKKWFHAPMRTNLATVYDPDYNDPSNKQKGPDSKKKTNFNPTQWIIAKVFRNWEIRLLSTEMPGVACKFRVPSKEAELVTSVLDKIIVQSCEEQKVARIRHKV